MQTLVLFFVFVIGAVVGSFLNVVILRYNTGRSITTERSQCFSCGKTLKWFELIPIFSFIAQRGRCRTCGSKISWQYVIVEIITGLSFVSVFWKIVPNLSFLYENLLSTFYSLIFYWTIFSILISISVYDLHHKIIPDGLVYSFIILSFVFSPLLSTFNFQLSTWLVSGPAIALPFFLLWFLSRGRWMGFGDVKLALGIGWFLGLVFGIYALLWSFWIGGAFAVTALFLKNIISKSEGKSSLFLSLRGLTIKSEIPFGPFLVLGTAIAFLLEWDFLFLNLILELL